MNVLVTGGAGYIGSQTCKVLAKAGHRPVAFDNLSTGWEDLVRWGPLVRGDLSDRASIRKAIREYEIETVVHFAAFSNVGESVRDPRVFFENNLGGTMSLVGGMLDEGVLQIVFSSTAAVYGSPDEIPIPEEHPHRPVNPYGVTKSTIEALLQSYDAPYGLRSVSLRYFNAAGADPEGETGERHEPELHLLPRVVDVALGRRDRVEIYGTDYPTPDGTAIRDYIHVLDLATAHVQALDYLLAGGSSVALNLGTGRGASVLEVVRAVEKITGRELPNQIGPRREGDPPQLVASAERARQLLGWHPEHSELEHIVETDWHWRRQDV